MPTSDKIMDLETLKTTREIWREKGEKVVFTNGCFDILHLGHVDYLEKSAALGQRLIIGLNSDPSVHKLKGDGRPVNPEYARARLLAALSFTDGIVLFGEDTPFNLISTLLPDILVKGSDYAIQDIVGADVVLKNGGEVQTVSLVDGYSTTSVIEKMQKD